MNTWKVILATLIIFGAGLVTGGLLSKRCNRPADKPLADTTTVVDSGAKGTNRVIPPPAQIPGMRKDFVKRLDLELHLAPEQREHIDKIMADGQEHIKLLWDQIAPQCSAQWHETLDKLRAELTDAQKIQFVEFMKNPRKKLPSTNAPPKQASAPVLTNAPTAPPATNAPAVTP